MAAAPLARLLLLHMFLVLSNTCRSCPEANSSCNGIQIRPPFKDVSHPACAGYFSVECDRDDEPREVLRIQLSDDHLYTIQNISYDDHLLVIRDEAPPPDSHHENYLYNFDEPVHMSDHSLSKIKLLEESRTLSECKKQDPYCLCDVFSPQDCATGDSCTSYGLFYSNTSESYRGVDSICSSSEEISMFFEWKILFNEYGELSLLSAGLSHGVRVLRPECFQHNATRGYICIQSAFRGKDQDVAANETGHKMRTKVIAIGITAALGFLLICAALLFLLICAALLFYLQQQLLHQCSSIFSTRSNNMQNIEAFLEERECTSPIRYKYSDLKRITKSFHEKLGQGGYGTVFRGTLRDGRLVAVKMLCSSEGNGEEFLNEVASTGRTSHVNVVRLLGFCMHGRRRALVYEFMSSGSLDKFICSDERRMSLGWKRLHDIAVGVARGLEYLHRGCNTRIVHFDIKPHNILLDDEFRPKISDFGMAKLCPPKDSIISMMDTRGTIGYIAPEVFCRSFGAVSTKSDVYSYGMMLLEMTGTTKDPSASDHGNSSEAYFPHWIYKQLELQDGYLQASGVTAEDSETAKKMILVGLWCIQTIPANRPSIRRVIEMLEGKMDDIELPPKPSFIAPPLTSVIDSSC